MIAAEARALRDSYYPTASAELVVQMHAAVENAAKKGWLRADVGNLVEPYSVPIIQEAYAQLRDQGYNVNVVTRTIAW